jgi:DNA-binding NtrC family response regulator
LTKLESCAIAHAATLSSIDAGVAVARGPAIVGRRLADVERELILETLAACGANRTRTARVLGISIRTLRNRLNEYARAGIGVPGHAARPRGAPCG